MRMHEIESFFSEYETKHNVEIPSDLKKFYFLYEYFCDGERTWKIFNNKLSDCFLYPPSKSDLLYNYFKVEFIRNEMLLKHINDNFIPVKYNDYLIIGIDTTLQKFLALKFEYGKEAGYFLIPKINDEESIFIFDKLNNNYDVEWEEYYYKYANITSILRELNHPLTQNLFHRSDLLLPRDFQNPIKNYQNILNPSEYYLLYTPLITERSYEMLLDSVNHLLKERLQLNRIKYDSKNEIFLVDYYLPRKEKEETLSLNGYKENITENIFSSLNKFLNKLNITDKKFVLILDKFFDDGQIAVSYINNDKLINLRESKSCFIWDEIKNQYN